MLVTEFCSVVKNALIKIASKPLCRSNLFCFAYWLFWMEFGNIVIFSGVYFTECFWFI